MGKGKFTYRDYVTDSAFLHDYNAYQSKYAELIRESDKVLLSLVLEIVERHEMARRRLQLLDIGCSTGNLLLHLKHAFPGIDLAGGGISPSPPWRLAERTQAYMESDSKN